MKNNHVKVIYFKTGWQLYDCGKNIQNNQTTAGKMIYRTFKS